VERVAEVDNRLFADDTKPRIETDMAFGMMAAGANRRSHRWPPTPIYTR
jgi:hypothetical protein